jgi:hypothetical protein
VTIPDRARVVRFLLVLCMLAAGASAFGSHGGPKSGTEPQGHYRSNYAAGVPRDAHGRIARDPRARNEFKRTHPCPSTGKTSGACKGYIIDHVQPLKRGGADSASNMQWQSEADARSKDRVE